MQAVGTMTKNEMHGEVDMQAHPMKALRFGIAIEVIGVSDRESAYAVAQAIRGHRPAPDRVVDAAGRVWQASQCTIVSPILDYTDIEVLQTIIRGVREAGGRASPYGGIHIHVNGKELDAEALAMLAIAIAQEEKGIAVSLGVRPPRALIGLRTGDPAQLVEGSAVQRGWRQARAGNAPDCLQGHDLLRQQGTAYRDPIEFRWFAFRTGFLHAGEVKAYIQFALALVAAIKCARGELVAAGEPMAGRRPRQEFHDFLLALGLVGDEFKTARHHMLKRFPVDPEPTQLGPQSALAGLADASAGVDGATAAPVLPTT